MGAGNGDDDGEIPDPEVADPVHRRQRPHRIPGDHLLGDPPHLGLGTGVARIAEPIDVGSPVVIPHGPHEQGGAPGGFVADGAEDLVEGERGLADGEELDGILRGLLAGVVVGGCHTSIVPHTGEERE